MGVPRCRGSTYARNRRKKSSRLTAGAPFGRRPGLGPARRRQGQDRRAEDQGKVDQAAADALQARAAAAMSGKMKPAYHRLAAWLTADRAQADAAPRGVGALPDGEAFYNAMLKQQTTTDMTADQIHALGLAEVARVRGEMETLKARIGFAGDLRPSSPSCAPTRASTSPTTTPGRAKYLALADGYLKA
jgi:uncharacterized protein (DUF885 family)